MLEVEVSIRGGCCTHVAVTDEQGEPVEFTLNLIDYDSQEDDVDEPTEYEPEFVPGDRVYWTDPDGGLCSGYGTVAEQLGDVYYRITKDDGGTVDAPESELQDAKTHID